MSIPLLFGSVTNMDDSSWLNNAQKGEAGQLLPDFMQRKSSITVRGMPIILQLPLAFLSRARLYAISCDMSSRRRPFVMMSKGHVNFNVRIFNEVLIWPIA
jgi:hypothetical protein